MNKKKKLIIVIAVILVLAVIGLGIWYFLKGSGGNAASAENAVYVDSVANITGLGSGDGQNGRYSGVIEPQDTWKIEVSQDKKVSEIYVEVGQEVKTGDKLFTYNTLEMQDSLSEAEIDLERKQNDIDTTNQQIAELQAEKKTAPADEQLSYTTQIQTAQNTVKRTEYGIKSKKVEIENLKKQLANADVLSEIDGMIKSINKDGTAMSPTGETEPFMTVLATGDYRVKGKVNEQNMAQIVEGSPVIVRSRVDEDKTWRGSLTAVDTDKPESSQNGMFMSSSGGSETTSSNYPFYVILDSAAGLMLGQHVYIEMDNGQDEQKDGVWLENYYLVMDENAPEEAFVWTASSKDKLEKRKVTLGEFDENQQKYEIKEGLTIEDYIAYPDDTLKEGTPTTKNIDQIMGDENMDEGGDMQGGGEIMPGGPMDNMQAVPEGNVGSAEPQMYKDEVDMSIDDIESGIEEDAVGDEENDENEGDAPAPENIVNMGDGSAPASAGSN